MMGIFTPQNQQMCHQGSPFPKGWLLKHLLRTSPLRHITLNIFKTKLIFFHPTLPNPTLSLNLSNRLTTSTWELLTSSLCVSKWWSTSYIVRTSIRVPRIQWLKWQPQNRSFRTVGASLPPSTHSIHLYIHCGPRSFHYHTWISSVE